MKIALIYDLIYPYSIGGVEIRNYRLAEFLSEKGHEVHVYGVKMWDGNSVIKKNNDNAIKNGSITIHGVCTYEGKHIFSGNRSYSDVLNFSMALKNELNKESFDIVDCTAFPYFPAFVCRDYCRRKKIPLVITWHEVWSEYWYEKLGILGFIGKRIEKNVSRISKNNIAVSRKTGEYLLKLNRNKKNITVINNWIDFSKIMKASPSELRSDIIFAGRHLKHKHIDILVKSMALVKKSHPHARLFIIGHGPETGNLKRLTRKLRLEKNIVFFNFFKKHSEIISLMKSSKIFVLPSTLEGFSISIIEASACNLPCITVKSKKNAAVNLIRNNKNGFVINLSKEEMAEKIIYLLNNEGKRMEMGSSAFAFSKHFDKNIIIPKIEEYYLKRVKK